MAETKIRYTILGQFLSYLALFRSRLYPSLSRLLYEPRFGLNPRPVMADALFLTSF
jgi:hypothetical protein